MTIRNPTPKARIGAGVLMLPLALGGACDHVDATEDVEPRQGPVVARDAGDASWVRQAVPVMLGRRIRGHAELRVLVDLLAGLTAQSSGLAARQRVVYGLSRDPEYVEHWSEFWMDALRVNRIGQKAQNSCYGPPLRGSDDGSLGRILRGRSAAAGPVVGVGTINMSDVLISSLEADDISPVYRAHLFPMMRHNIASANEIDPATLRRDALSTFSAAYMRRDFMCLGCHNSTASVTGPASQWDRTFPLTQNEDISLLTRYPDRVGALDPRDVEALFRTDVLGGSEQPFGLTSACGGFVAANQLPSDPELGSGFLAFDYPDGSIWDVESLLRTGVDRFAQFGGVTRIGPIPTVQRDRALALRVASIAADRVWQDVMGYPLTIAHSYPRNVDQRDELRRLVEQRFVRMRFSPQYLLTGILTNSPAFNRKSPSFQEGTTPYDLPMLFDPWVAVDPRENSDPAPYEEGNSMTDAIHRWSARNLWNSVAVAMDWPTPTRFPADLDDPATEFMRSLGQFMRDSEPGSRGTDFAGMLHWEEYVGQTESPAGADWIDRVVAGVAVFDAAHPQDRLTLEDLAVTVRDWLLGDGTIANVASTTGQVELAAVEALFGAPLSTPAASLGSAQLEDSLRAIAGVYLQSPQFMLAGIAPTEIGPSPRLRICNTGACTYREICEEIAPLVAGQMYAITCGDDSMEVERASTGNATGTLMGQLCNNVTCTFEFFDVRTECATDPAMCPRTPPACDPRCESGFECCGSPWLDGDPEGIISVWGEGGWVSSANAVRVLPAGAEKWATLEADMQLGAGDLIEFDSTSTFVLDLPEGKLSSPDDGVPKTPNGGPWYMLVSGPSALPEVSNASGTAPGELDWALIEDAWWMQNGDASQPPK